MYTRASRTRWNKWPRHDITIFDDERCSTVCDVSFSSPISHSLIDVHNLWLYVLGYCCCHNSTTPQLTVSHRQIPARTFGKLSARVGATRTRATGSWCIVWPLPLNGWLAYGARVSSAQVQRRILVHPHVRAKRDVYSRVQDRLSFAIPRCMRALLLESQRFCTRLSSFYHLRQDQCQGISPHHIYCIGTLASE